MKKTIIIISLFFVAFISLSGCITSGGNDYKAATREQKEAIAERIKETIGNYCFACFLFPDDCSYNKEITIKISQKMTAATEYCGSDGQTGVSNASYTYSINALMDYSDNEKPIGKLEIEKSEIKSGSTKTIRTTVYVDTATSTAYIDRILTEDAVSTESKIKCALSISDINNEIMRLLPANGKFADIENLYIDSLINDEDVPVYVDGDDNIKIVLTAFKAIKSELYFDFSDSDCKAKLIFDGKTDEPGISAETDIEIESVPTDKTVVLPTDTDAYIASDDMIDIF